MEGCKELPLQRSVEAETPLTLDRPAVACDWRRISGEGSKWHRVAAVAAVAVAGSRDGSTVEQREGLGCGKPLP